MVFCDSFLCSIFRKLLKTLDDAIAKKKVPLSDLAVDEAYMTQFVIQRKSEISGKDVLAKTIKAFNLDVSIPKSPAVNIDLTDNGNWNYYHLSVFSQ